MLVILRGYKKPKNYFGNYLGAIILQYKRMELIIIFKQEVVSDCNKKYLPSNWLPFIKGHNWITDVVKSWIHQD